MKITIAIPARWGSSRFPGKPLAMIAGQSMLSRVVGVARAAAAEFDNVDILVTTEDQRIADHAKELNVECIITPADCATGSDRVLAALETLDEKPDFVINLQGDAPFTPPIVISDMIKVIEKHPENLEVVTPIHQLSWDDLDRLRQNKTVTPFSGTTVLRYQKGHPREGYAFAFSKQIIPAIRNEENLREKDEKSPVFQHMGIYGYSIRALEKFVKMPQSYFEKLEGLEQLRMIENGISIFTIKVIAPSGTLQSGIDTPEDLARAEALLQERGAA